VQLAPPTICFCALLQLLLHAEQLIDEQQSVGPAPCIALDMIVNFNTVDFSPSRIDQHAAIVLARANIEVTPKILK
jgi:hypothetical protein